MPIYADIYDGPPRHYGRERTGKRYVAIHATANDASAEAEASWAKRRPDSTSSHFYVDDDSIVQSLDTDLRAFHSGSRRGNDLAISYELTARDMSVGRAWWLDHDNIEWPLLTAAIARDCVHFGITPRNLTVAEITAGRLGGIIDHNEMRQAWGGTDHTDPGPHFPMDHLVRQVQAALEDDVSAEDVWRFPTTNVRGDPKNAITLHRWTNEYAKRLLEAQEEHLAVSRATHAAVTGQDPTAAVRAELDRHRGVLLAEVAERLDGLGDRLAEALPDVPAEQVRAAVAAELAGLRLVTEAGGQEPA